MGAWIEILDVLGIAENIVVAPYMGAWIEITVDDGILAME